VRNMILASLLLLMAVGARAQNTETVPATRVALNSGEEAYFTLADGSWFRLACQFGDGWLYAADNSVLASFHIPANACVSTWAGDHTYVTTTVNGPLTVDATHTVDVASWTARRTARSGRGGGYSYTLVSGHGTVTVD
jgi:hypothetical protein